MPTVEEIQKLVSFTRTDREWRVKSVFGSVLGDVWANVEGNVWGNVGSYVGGSVGRSVLGSVSGDVEGNVSGTIGGREWAPVLTLKERICQAVERGDTELALELLQGADISEVP